MLLTLKEACNESILLGNRSKAGESTLTTLARTFESSGLGSGSISGFGYWQMQYNDFDEVIIYFASRFLFMGYELILLFLIYLWRIRLRFARLFLLPKSDTTVVTVESSYSFISNVIPLLCFCLKLVTGVF